MDFDKDFEKIKKISNELEDENITVDESMKKYIEACELIEKCVKELTEAKGKVTVLREKIENIIEENFE